MIAATPDRRPAVSIRASKVVWRCFHGEAATAAHKLVLLALADMCDDVGDSLHPSIATLADLADLSERSVQRVMSDLIGRGLVDVVGYENGGPTSRRYRLRLDRIAAMRPEALDRRSRGRRRGDARVRGRGDAHVTGGGDTHVTPRAGGGVTSTSGEGRHVRQGGGDTGVTRSIIEPPLNHHHHHQPEFNGQRKSQIDSAATSAADLRIGQPNGLGSDTRTEPGHPDTGHSSLACPIERIVEVYHQALPDAPRCAYLTARRRREIALRWHESARVEGWQSVDDGVQWFRGFFEHVTRSRWLMGRVTDRQGRSFEVRLDWLMAPDNFAKTLEGVYHREAP